MTRTNHPPRVAYLDDRPELGGAELALVEYFHYIHEVGVEPILVTTRDSALADRARKLGVRCLIVKAGELVKYERSPNIFKATRNPLDWAAYFGRTGGTVLRLARALRRANVDVVHTNTLRAHLYGTLAAAMIGKPVVWHVRDILHRRWQSMLFRVLGPRAAAIVAVSEASARSLNPNGPRLPNVRVVYNTIDLSRAKTSGPKRLAEVRSELGVEDAFPIVAILGQVIPWKGHADFVEAAALVRDRFPNAAFLVVGDSLLNSSAFKQALAARMRALDLERTVRFVGFRNDVPDVLSQLTAMVSASWAEPFGRTVMEAMALGVPVVATDAGGTPELIRNGENGLLVPPHDPAALARAIIRLAEDSDVRATVGAGGKATISAQFDVHREVCDLARIYRDVLARRRS
jgi:glycosyltransferase involved in cell wall biosynthesis